MSRISCRRGACGARHRTRIDPCIPQATAPIACTSGCDVSAAYQGDENTVDNWLLTLSGITLSPQVFYIRFRDPDGVVIASATYTTAGTPDITTDAPDAGSDVNWTTDIQPYFTTSGWTPTNGSSAEWDKRSWADANNLTFGDAIAITVEVATGNTPTCIPQYTSAEMSVQTRNAGMVTPRSSRYSVDDGALYFVDTEGDCVWRAVVDSDMEDFGRCEVIADIPVANELPRALDISAPGDTTNGRPTVYYQSQITATNRAEIRQLVWDGSAWVDTLVFSPAASQSNNFGGLLVDYNYTSNGQPIFWLGQIGGDIRLFYFNGSSWSNEFYGQMNGNRALCMERVNGDNPVQTTDGIRIAVGFADLASGRRVNSMGCGVDNSGSFTNYRNDTRWQNPVLGAVVGAGGDEYLQVKNVGRNGAFGLPSQGTSQLFGVLNDGTGTITFYEEDAADPQGVAWGATAFADVNPPSGTNTRDLAFIGDGNEYIMVCYSSFWAAYDTINEVYAFDNYSLFGAPGYNALIDGVQDSLKF